MAATISVYLSSSNQSQFNFNFKSFKTPFLYSKQTNPLQIYQKSHRFNTIISFSTSQSSTILDPLRPSRFLTEKELEKLHFLENFRYFQELESGSMLVRVMRDDEIDMTVGLLSESFAESMVMMPNQYVNLLGIIVKQYINDRRFLMPHTATLIAFYKGDDDEEESEVELAGTVEISFNKMGANDSSPTPTPPKDSPYICNMAVHKSLRRRGIGWHLLKACEELISQMSSSNEIYLHCRMIDTAPLTMYTKAGYSIVETDNILVLLTLQRHYAESEDIFRWFMIIKLPILHRLIYPYLLLRRLFHADTNPKGIIFLSEQFNIPVYKRQDNCKMTTISVDGNYNSKGEILKYKENMKKFSTRIVQEYVQSKED